MDFKYLHINFDNSRKKLDSQLKYIVIALKVPKLYCFTIHIKYNY